MLDEAVALAGRWLEGVRDGPIPPTADVEQVKDALGRELPERGPDPVTVLRSLAEAAEPGLMRIHFRIPGSTDISYLVIDWSLFQFALAAGVAMLAAMTAAYLPARRAAKVEPVDVLRGGT